jgi:hypothetical protein
MILKWFQSLQFYYYYYYYYLCIYLFIQYFSRNPVWETTRKEEIKRLGMETGIYRRFVTTYRFRLQGSNSPRRQVVRKQTTNLRPLTSQKNEDLIKGCSCHPEQTYHNACRQPQHAIQDILNQHCAALYAVKHVSRHAVDHGASIDYAATVIALAQQPSAGMELNSD